MTIFAIGLLLLFVIIGYNLPKQSSWFWLIILPMIYPTFFVIVYSKLIPLTFDKLAFASSVGIVLKRFYFFKRFFKQTTVVKYIFGFYFVLVLFSLRDDGVKTIIYTTIPQVFTAIVLVVNVITQPKDLNNLFMIFVFQGTLLGLFVISEFLGFKPINIYTLNPELAKNILDQTSAYEVRSGFYRPQGIDGNSVQTAYRMIMYFPISLWWFLKRKNKILSILPLIIVISSIVFLQSRATYSVLMLSIFSLFYYVFKVNTFSLKDRWKLIRIFIISFFLLVIVSIFLFPTIQKIVLDSFVHNIFGSSSNLETKVVRGRQYYLLTAVLHFLQRPVFGYGSPAYSYKIINYVDIPSFAMYALSGGIILFLIYIVFVYQILKNAYKLIKIKEINAQFYYLPLFIFLSVFGGLTVTLFNWQEAHFLTMFLILFSIISYVYNRSYYNSPKNRAVS